MEVSVIFFAGGLLLLVVVLVWAAGKSLSIWQAQRTGLRLKGEVTDVDTSQRRWHGGVTPRPIVRYFLDGQWIEVTLANYAGRLPTGTTVDLAVDRQQPDRAYFAYGNEFVATIVICAVFIVVDVVLLRNVLAGR